MNTSAYMASRHCYQISKNERGRSMVEMLGVLAIIGVLSIGGISGYTYAMRSYRANEIINGASLLYMAGIAQGGGLGIGEMLYTEAVGPCPPGSSEMQYNDPTSLIIAMDSEEVCEQVKKQIGTSNLMSAGDCIAVEGGYDLALTFAGSALGDGSGSGTSDPRCSGHGTYSDGACECSLGYKGDSCETETECFATALPSDLGIGEEFCIQKEMECKTLISCPATSFECIEELGEEYCTGCCGIPDRIPANATRYVGTISGGKCMCKYSCFTADTPIALADGSYKRADEVTYDDELLVWNFDEGHMDTAYPLWLKIAEVAPEYNYLRFSDGSVLKTIIQHRIFNREAGKFTYPMTDETPIGTTTLNAKGEWVTLVEKKVVQEEVIFYNIITEHHINCFAGNVLTSCRYNNIYPIQDMKFVKDDRELVPYSEYAVLGKRWYDGLRLAEQPRDIASTGGVPHGSTIIEHIQKCIAKAQPYSRKKVA